jgi:hypothetical protein
MYRDASHFKIRRLERKKIFRKKHLSTVLLFTCVWVALLRDVFAHAPKTRPFVPAAK